MFFPPGIYPFLFVICLFLAIHSSFSRHHLKLHLSDSLLLSQNDSVFAGKKDPFDIHLRFAVPAICFELRLADLQNYHLLGRLTLQL